MRDSLRRIGPDLAALLVVVIWGVNFVFVKAAFEEFDVLPFVFLRYAAMIALGWLVVGWHARRGGAWHIAREDRPRLVVTGLLGYAAYITLSMVGLDYTTAFSNALLLALSPLFMAGLLRLLGLERVVPAQVAAMLLAVAGVFVFLLEKASDGFGSASWGDLLSLAAAGFFAAYNVAGKPLMTRYPAVVVTAWALTIGAAPVLLLSLPALPAQDWGAIGWVGWGTLAWSVVLPIYVAWTVWGWAGARVGVARTSVYMYLVPLAGGVTAWLLLDEGFGPQKLAGALLEIAGLALARRAAARAAAPSPDAELEPVIPARQSAA